MRRSTALFGALWIATIAGAVAMVAMMANFLSTSGSDQSITLPLGVIAADAIFFSSMGLLILRQRPGNRIAWVLGAAGALIILTFNGFVIGALAFLTVGGDDVVGGFAALIGATTLGPALFVALALLPILFPDGRLPGPRWRGPVAVAFGLILIPSIVGLVQPGPVNTELPDNPLGLDLPAVVALRDLGGLLPLGLLGAAVLAVAAVATRIRRSTGVERQQMKWLLGSVTVIGLFLPLSFADTFLDDAGAFTIIDAIAMASMALLPISIAIAVLRYRLYEIDRLISRTIGWAVVTGVLVAVFALGVIGLQTVLAGFTQGETLAVAASTLIAFALFQPVRRRVQRAVDRRFDRARYDGERTAAAFAERLRDQVDLATLRQTLVATTDEAVRPVTAAVWLRTHPESSR
jgi:hypothetical protein